MKPYLTIGKIFSLVACFCLLSCKKRDDQIINQFSAPLLPPASNYSFSCSNRPVHPVKLIPFATLSEARINLVGAAAGNKILFANGWLSNKHSTRVDIYDTISQTWSIAELTIPERDGMAVATLGNKIFFAGGGNNDWIDVTKRIDIFDATTNLWSRAELSKARKYLSATTLGDKVYFAGGGNWDQPYFTGVTTVDIYDNSSNTWSTANLSEGRYELSATTIGDKIYFAGGLHDIFSGSSRIDIYNASENSWSTDQLKEIKASHAAVAVDNQVLWVAGANTPYWKGYHYSSMVEIKDLTTGLSSFDCITPKAKFSAVGKGEYIVFFTGMNNSSGNSIDIYHTPSKTWSLGALPVSIHGAAIIGTNNTIYVAGGQVNGSVSNQVWKMEF